MNIIISGVSHSIDGISVDTENFGKAPAAGNCLTYALRISRDQVLLDFEQYYNDYINDSLTYGIDDAEAIDQLLEKLQFPSFNQLIDAHPDTAGAFLMHVVFDFLNAVFLHFKSARHLYYVRTVDSLQVQGKDIVLSGLILNYRRELLDRIGNELPDGLPCEEPRYGFNSGYWEKEE